MIFLIASILASSLIFVIFRLFPKFKIDTFQAIVFNYFTACISGFVLYGSDLKPIAFEQTSWIQFAILCGILFISLFLIMGISSQKNGVATTSVAVKMSMAMSMLLMILIYGESVNIFKISGIIAAIGGVLAMSWSAEKNQVNKPIYWMLAVLFVGSGALDITLNYVQNQFSTTIPPSLFSAFGFGIAGLIGSSILIVNILRKKMHFSFKNVLGGIILGIPNYFSIYLLMQSYSSMKPWSDSTVLAITNVSIVLLSAFYGFVLFREKLTTLKGIGLIISLAAIALLYVASL